MEIPYNLQIAFMVFGAIHLLFYTFYYTWWILSGIYKSIFSRKQRKLSFRSFLAKRIAPGPKRRTPKKKTNPIATKVVQLGRSKVG